MGILNSLFKKGDKFDPDYRDTILYNGSIAFKATGVFNDDLLEFYEVDNPSNKIFFNPNLKKPEYIKQHDNYDLVRNKDGSSFVTFEITTAQGAFFPTGRIFKNEAGLDILWEFMKKNNPQHVMFFKLPLNENFIRGKKCEGM